MKPQDGLGFFVRRQGAARSGSRSLRDRSSGGVSCLIVVECEPRQQGYRKACQALSDA